LVAGELAQPLPAHMKGLPIQVEWPLIPLRTRETPVVLAGIERRGGANGQRLKPMAGHLHRQE
jgi:hypothetical protein